MSINKAASDAKSFRKQFAAFWRVAEALEEMGDLDAQRNDLEIKVRELDEQLRDRTEQASKAISEKVHAEAALVEAETRKQNIEIECEKAVKDATSKAGKEADEIIKQAKEQVDYFRKVHAREKDRQAEWKAEAAKEKAAMEAELGGLRGEIAKLKEKFA